MNPDVEMLSFACSYIIYVCGSTGTGLLAPRGGSGTGIIHMVQASYWD
jgi:hypothetical protein